MTETAKRLWTRSDANVSVGFVETARLALRQFGFVGSVARYLMLRDEMRRFVVDAASHGERAYRKQLLRRFGAIHANVPCAHSPFQFVLMARYLFDLHEPGPIVQCGAFKGGSTAKLSLLAERTQRKLYVCDSFQGLPASDESGTLKPGFGDLPDYVFRAGEYCGSLDEVRDNVARYGSLAPCEFVSGWFSETLPALAIAPAFVFMDVDFVASARDCLASLWPRLVDGGQWFTHEAMFPDYMTGIMDPTWWRATLGECPPIVMGAGSGLSAAAPSIAYFTKPRPHRTD